MKSISATLLVLVALLLICTGSKVAAQPPKCSLNENCRLYCARFGTTPLCFEGVCRCFSKETSTIEESHHSKSPLGKEAAELALPHCQVNSDCKPLCGSNCPFCACIQGICFRGCGGKLVVADEAAVGRIVEPNN